MSSSSASRGGGRVFFGLDTPGPASMSVQEFEGKKDLTWDDATDQEFLSRVRTKAQDMAKDILRSAMREAEVLKEKARNAGVEQGLAEGQQQLEQHLDNIGAGLGQMLESIQSQAPAVWEARKPDLLALVRLAVEKTLAVELSKGREQVLSALLDEGLERIEADTLYVIRVAPSDEEIMQELLERARAVHPHLERWQIKPDESVSAGAVIEARNAKVDNTVDSRFESVSAILDKLGLDAGETDPSAEA